MQHQQQRRRLRGGSSSSYSSSFFVSFFLTRKWKTWLVLLSLSVLIIGSILQYQYYNNNYNNIHAPSNNNNKNNNSTRTITSSISPSPFPPLSITQNRQQKQFRGRVYECGYSRANFIRHLFGEDFEFMGPLLKQQEQLPKNNTKTKSQLRNRNSRNNNNHQKMILQYSITSNDLIVADAYGFCPIRKQPSKYGIPFNTKIIILNGEPASIGGKGKLKGGGKSNPTSVSSSNVVGHRLVDTEYYQHVYHLGPYMELQQQQQQQSISNESSSSFSKNHHPHYFQVHHMAAYLLEHIDSSLWSRLLLLGSSSSSSSSSIPPPPLSLSSKSSSLSLTTMSSTYPNLQKPINRGIYHGVAYYVSNCTPLRQKTARIISTIIPVYVGGECHPWDDDDYDYDGYDGTRTTTRGGGQGGEKRHKGTIHVLTPKERSVIVVGDDYDTNDDIQSSSETSNTTITTSTTTTMVSIDRTHHWDNWKLYNQFEYCLVMENTYKHGYVTEKLLLALLGGCLPIYYGSDEVLQWFNPKVFIYYNISSSSSLNQQSSSSSSKIPIDVQALNELSYLWSNHTAYLERMEQEPLFINQQQQERTLKYIFSLTDSIGGGYLKQQIRSLVLAHE